MIKLTRQSSVDDCVKKWVNRLYCILSENQGGLTSTTEDIKLAKAIDFLFSERRVLRQCVLNDAEKRTEKLASELQKMNINGYSKTQIKTYLKERYSL